MKLALNVASLTLPEDIGHRFSGPSECASPLTTSQREAPFLARHGAQDLRGWLRS
jgi:hypothetical protein